MLTYISVRLRLSSLFNRSVVIYLLRYVAVTYVVCYNKQATLDMEWTPDIYCLRADVGKNE